MWPRFYNSKWFVVVTSITGSIILMLLTQRLTSSRQDYVISKQQHYDDSLRRSEIKRQDSISVARQLGDKASYFYVDKQDGIIRDEMAKDRTEHQLIWTQFNLNITEINKNMRLMNNNINILNANLNNYIFNSKKQ